MIPFHNSELNLAEIDLSHNKLKVVTVKINTNKEGKKKYFITKSTFIKQQYSTS